MLVEYIIRGKNRHLSYLVSAVTTKAILAKCVKSGRDIFGSDRREIFIAFAQSGYQPTHLIPNLIMCALSLKTMASQLRLMSVYKRIG